MLTFADIRLFFLKLIGADTGGGGLDRCSLLLTGGSWGQKLGKKMLTSVMTAPKGKTQTSNESPKKSRSF